MSQNPLPSPPPDPSPDSVRPLIRPATEADMEVVTAIYAHSVLHSTTTFEESAPDVLEMQRRRADVLSRNLPYLVLEHKGAVQGYAYANWFKPRRAYRFSAEDSIYLHPDACGKGLGRVLLGALLEELTCRGIRRALAVIGGDNAASIGLHTACGFTHVGTVPATGYKFEQWIDLVFMQRALGEGSLTDPH